MDLSALPSLDSVELSGRRVLTRVDFSVPLQNGVITDDTRIRRCLPTIKLLQERGARVVLMSHLGRPGGKPEPRFSLEPVAARLAELLEIGEVVLTDSCVGDGAKRVVLDLRDGHVALLENLRFHSGETENDDKFARELAALADVYVNDAFAAAHRSHASSVAVARHVRDKAAGLLLEQELRALAGLLGEVRRPFVAVLGGAKVSDKIGIIENLLKRVDALVIGGAMANTFIAAQGGQLGASMVEHDKLPLARDLLVRAKQLDVKVLLPSDAVAAAHPEDENTQVVPAGEVPRELMAFDIGPAARAAFKDELVRAGTVLWNGPMGMFEMPQFAEGSIAVARAIAGASAFSVVGGGDSVAAVRQSGLERGFDHVSTGGGATLALLEGKALPGVTALGV